jgi:NitT/TauT family transport system substrate-binding protein
MSISRRVLIAIVVVVIAIVAGLTLIEPAGPTHVRVGYIPATTSMLVWVAYENGYYEEEGLDVELIPFNGVTDEAVAFARAEVDGGPLTGVATACFAENARLIIVGGNSLDGTALCCRPEDAGKYRSIQDLEGTSISTVKYAPGDVILRHALKEYQISVNMTYVFGPPNAIYSVAKGLDDVGLLFEPFASLSEAEGGNVTLCMWDKDIYDIEYPCCLQVFTESFVNAHPDDVVKYLRAMVKAQEFCETNPDEAVRLTAHYMPEFISPDVTYRSTFYKDPALDGRTRNPLDMTLYMEDLENYTDMIVDLGLLSQRDAERFLQRVDLSYWNKALSE